MVTRGEIYRADLDPVTGSEQGGSRPVLIIQNDVGNQYSPTVIVAAITSKITKGKMPTHITIPGYLSGLPRDSVVLTEQLRTIDKQRLVRKIGELPREMMLQVNEALLLSLGVGES
jgi:mRNA interferase MazF